MRKTIPVFVLMFLAMHSNVAWSSDACSTRAITAAVDVKVSDGSSFKVETYFHSRDMAAIRHIREPQQIIVVEGPQSWTQVGDQSDPGTEFHKLFALGHQFHAFVLHFEDVTSDVRRTDGILFNNETREALSGDYPYGGVVHLIQGDDKNRPAGLLFEFSEDTVISVIFADWRDTGEVSLPYHLQVDDRERIFDYHYSEISVAPRSPLWFFDTVRAPPIDNVQVHRLHRKLLAAHCLGDADMMANLSTPKVLTANRGEIQHVENDAIRVRFSALFGALDYTEYHDIVLPSIDLSADGSLGWIGAKVLARGSEIESGNAFSQQWAWVMMVKKVDNIWLHAGNASNRPN